MLQCVSVRVMSVTDFGIFLWNDVTVNIVGNITVVMSMCSATDLCK